jgi:uncharacterized protein (DUF1800 family)
MLNEFVYIAANRFGHGINPKLAKSLHNIDSLQGAQAWLISQMAPYKLNDVKWSSEDAMLSYYQFKEQQKLERENESESKSKSETQNNMMSAGSKQLRRDMIASARKLAQDNALSGLTTEQPLCSRLLSFFSNHFAVSRSNTLLTLLSPTLETEAIAPRLHKRFSDILIAVTTHPAMLMYLNNERSMGPNSKTGKRRKAKKQRGAGLNENLAREILELHTLGVHSGYKQDDVVELARAITGWSISNVKKGEDPGFVFRANMQEPGNRALLGKTYSLEAISFRNDSLAAKLAKQNPQMSLGLKMLDDLANHPSTAEHVSYKLAKYFISDNVPKALVDAMKKTWLATNGDMNKIISTMIANPLSWQKKADKFKSPRAFVLSACNACGVKKPAPDLYRTLEILGHGFFNSGSPAGYEDEQKAWLGTSALNSRIEWASYFADQITKRKKVEPLALAQQALGPLLSQASTLAIKRAESKQQALALFLLSPDFQRR